MFDDVAETFGNNLFQKVRSVSTDKYREEENLVDGALWSRSKRQTTNIPDESPLPHEIRTSRLK